MNVIFTGNGRSGSWRIRGVQLAEAVGGQSIPNAFNRAMKKADVVVAVKRVSALLLDQIKKSERPFIWDVVDAWPQPEGNTWGRDECMRWLSDELKRLKPQMVIGATQSMVDDVHAIGFPAEVLYHHVRPDIRINPIREKVRVVGYEGGDNYVERWGKYLTSACERRGWVFQQTRGQTSSLHHFDIAVALRDYTGYAPIHWKSNVKLVNAMGSGTPFIGASECGYTETACGVEYWSDTVGRLDVCLDWLASHSTRQIVHERLLLASEKFSLNATAARMKAIINAL